MEILLCAQAQFKVIFSRALPDLPKDTRMYWYFAHSSPILLWGSVSSVTPLRAQGRSSSAPTSAGPIHSASRAGGASESLLCASLSAGRLTSWQFTVAPGAGVGVWSHEGSPGINIHTLQYNVAQTAAVPGVSESDSTEPLTLSLFMLSQTSSLSLPTTVCFLKICFSE